MSKQTKILIATGNLGKTREIITIIKAGLPEYDIKFLTFRDYPQAKEPNENGATYAENAVIKAEYGAKLTGLISLGDDVGLEVEALDGQPGLHSRRFAGADTPFDEKIRLILEKMKGVSSAERGALFRAAVAVTAPKRATKVFESYCEGSIAYEPKGLNGFGYDPIFYLKEHDCTMAELDPAVKNQISHRAKVLALALPYLRELITAEHNQ